MASQFPSKSAYDRKSVHVLIPDSGIYNIPETTSSIWQHGRYPIDAICSFIKINERANTIVGSHDSLACDAMVNFEFLPSVHEIHITHSSDVQPSAETYNVIVGAVLERINEANPEWRKQVTLFIPNECITALSETYLRAMPPSYVIYD